MKIALMQPYFFPYIGYFQLINAVDHFIIYDDVKYINDGWIHRNRILLNGGPAYINLPVKKCGGCFINQKEVSTNELERCKAKILGQLHASYRKLPNYPAVIELLESVMDQREKSLALFLESLIRAVCQKLAIHTPISLSSSIPRDDEGLQGENRVIALCKALNADIYINAIGGKELYSGARFSEAGVALRFLKTDNIHYKQPIDGFIPSLSILDVMLCNDDKSIAAFLDAFTLID